MRARLRSLQRCFCEYLQVSFDTLQLLVPSSCLVFCQSLSFEVVYLHTLVAPSSPGLEYPRSLNARSHSSRVSQILFTQLTAFPLLQCSNMEFERHTPSQQFRHGMLPTKQLSPVEARKSVSVAAIFKQKLQKIKDNSVNPKRVTNDSRAAENDRALQFKSRSSSRTPRKAGSRVTKRSNLHPLAVTFKSTYKCTQYTHSSD
jgi:hypothetical protein